MHYFVRNLITEWRRLKLPFKGETVVVAVSGGADSVSLLLALHELKNNSKLDLQIAAAHFNHQLRGAESDADEEFVVGLTTELGIGLVLHRGHISGDGNLEQNARDARYDFLPEAALNLNAFAVLTGHTVNDQAETFLLNLIRGSGPEGLGGMRVVRDLEGEKGRNGERETKAEGETQGHGDTGSKNIETASPLLPFTSSPPLLVRPLLTWAKRIDTEAFCHERGVEYRYDTMNDDTAFKRVRIRKILLPLLEDMNPKIVETLANTAALMQNVQVTGNHLPIADELILGEVKTLPKSELYDAIRSWLRHHRGTTRQLQLKHIQAIERLIFSQKSGKTAELPGGKVIKSAGKLVYDENKVEN